MKVMTLTRVYKVGFCAAENLWNPLKQNWRQREHHVIGVSCFKSRRQLVIAAAKLKIL